MEPLRIVTINSSFLLDFIKRPDGSLYAKAGTDAPLLQILSEYIPFSYSIIHRKDNIYGHIDSNGQWTGMISMLIKNEADVAIGWVGNTYARHQVVDFSFPYIVDTNVFVTASPKALHNGFAFLYPFQLLVWILFLVSIVCSALINASLRRFNLFTRNKNINFAKIWMKEMEKIVTLLLSQGSYKHYVSEPLRIFMYVWSLAKLVLVFSYTCTLLSFLISPLKEHSLKSVHELRNAVVGGKYQFGAFRGTSHMANLMEADTGDIKDLANHIRQHPENVYRDFEKAIQRIQREKFSMLCMRLHFLYVGSKHGLGNFYVSPDAIGFNPVSVAFRKGYPHMEKINLLIHRIWETGIYLKTMKEYMYKFHLRAPSSAPDDKKKSLSLSDLETIFQLLVVGLLVSTICFIIEMLHGKFSLHRCCNTRNFKLQ